MFFLFFFLIHKYILCAQKWQIYLAISTNSWAITQVFISLKSGFLFLSNWDFRPKMYKWKTIVAIQNIYQRLFEKKNVLNNCNWNKVLFKLRPWRNKTWNDYNKKKSNFFLSFTSFCHLGNYFIVHFLWL